jgi:hypothetical protein
VLCTQAKQDSRKKVSVVVFNYIQEITGNGHTSGFGTKHKQWTQIPSDKSWTCLEKGKGFLLAPAILNSQCHGIKVVGLCSPKWAEAKLRMCSGGEHSTPRV